MSGPGRPVQSSVSWQSQKTLICQKSIFDSPSSLTSSVSLVDGHLVEEALAEQLHVPSLGGVVQRARAAVMGGCLKVVAWHLVVVVMVIMGMP